MKSTTAFDDQFSEEPDSTLARTGNTAAEQDMFAAGLEAGEDNAKSNAAIRAASATVANQAAMQEAVLTDDEILAATLYGQSEARMIRNGRAIESALLSKLVHLAVAELFRAPAAGDALLPNLDLDAAAKTLAECMDYPWAHMPEQGREQMRKNAKSVIDAAIAQQKGEA